MHIRPLDTARDDLASLGSVARESLEAVLSRKLTSVDRCYVAGTAEGQIVGLVGFGELDRENAAVVETLALRWNTDALPVADTLIASATDSLPGRPSALVYIIDVPDADPGSAPERERVMRRLGFTVIRRTRRWERPTTRPPGASTDAMLTHRSSRELPVSVLEEAVRDVSSTTLDRALRANRRRRGADADAREHARLLRELSDGFDGIALANDRTGALVGVSAVGRVGTRPLISLIGVVPEHRGRGHAGRLLVAATQRAALVFPDAVILADSDVENEPMARCFRRAGYRQFATRTELRRQF